MTLKELYQNGKRYLEKAGTQDPAFDAACLFEKVFGLSRQQLFLQGDQPADEENNRKFWSMVCQRAEKRPLQYILGEWEFMGLRLYVGEGVLIPRGETELLVTTMAAALSNNPSPCIVDLCGGTGAVSLGLASLLPQAHITCVELYDEAYSYLNKNIAAYAFSHVSAVKQNILQPESPMVFPLLDGIISNPPYVTTQEMETLQPEVLREPRTALEGGADGLFFYRAIAGLWLKRLKAGGTAAVEIGETQGMAVQQLFESAGLQNIHVLQDLAGLDRVVCAQKPK